MKKGILLTLGMLFLSGLVFSLAVLLFHNTQGTENRFAEISLYDRLFDLDSSIQKGFKEIFERNSGMSLSLLNDTVSIAEILPHSSNFEAEMVAYSDFLELMYPIDPLLTVDDSVLTLIKDRLLLHSSRSSQICNCFNWCSFILHGKLKKGYCFSRHFHRLTYPEVFRGFLSRLPAGLPKTFPSFLALSRPEIVRATINSLSYWAKTHNMLRKSLPSGVVVLIFCVIEINSTFLEANSSSNTMRCFNDLPIRSSLYTTTQLILFARISVNKRLNSGLLSSLPEALSEYSTTL